MSLIRTGMDCNPMMLLQLPSFCGFRNAGDADIARVSQESDSVDVDAEFSHGRKKNANNETSG